MKKTIRSTWKIPMNIPGTNGLSLSGDGRSPGWTFKNHTGWSSVHTVSISWVSHVFFGIRDGEHKVKHFMTY
jgi:hypothetical protein